MKYSTPLLCSVLLLIALACDSPFQEQSHDFIMRAKIAKIELAGHNFTIDRKTRKARSLAAAKELSLEYPAAPPFPKDTTDSIFVARLPKKVRGFPLESKKVVYKKPPFEGELLEMFGTKRLSNKTYYEGSVMYLTNTKKGKYGTGVSITDAGSMPEWAVTWLFDKLYKGEGDKLFGSLVPGFEFEKTVDYKGHTWGLWVPGSMLQKIMTKNHSPDVTIFTSQWNSRFIVAQVDADTAASNLETFYQVVNVPYLSKLRSPERQKHVMPK